MCVSVAVETTGWYHAQQSWRRGELVDRLAVFGPNSGQQAHPGGGGMALPANWRRRRGKHGFAALFSGNLVASGYATRKDKVTFRGSLAQDVPGGGGEGGRGRCQLQRTKKNPGSTEAPRSGHMDDPC